RLQPTGRGLSNPQAWPRDVTYGSPAGGGAVERPRVAGAREVVAARGDDMRVAEVVGVGRQADHAMTTRRQAVVPGGWRVAFDEDVHVSRRFPGVEAEPALARGKGPTAVGDRGRWGLSPSEHARQQLQQELRLAGAAHRPDHRRETFVERRHQRGRQRVWWATTGPVLGGVA